MSLKAHRRWFRLFLILGLAGVLDIATRNVTFSQAFGLPNLGPGVGALATGAGLLSAYVSAKLFGAGVGTIVGTDVISTLALLFSLAILWLPLAWFEHTKIKKIRSQLASLPAPHSRPTRKPKNFKLLWTISTLVVGFFLIGVLATAGVITWSRNQKLKACLAQAEPSVQARLHTLCEEQWQKWCQDNPSACMENILNKQITIDKCALTAKDIYPQQIEDMVTKQKDLCYRHFGKP